MANLDSSRAERIAALGYRYDIQPKIEVSRCDLCEGEAFTVISHVDRYDFPAKAIHCDTCGLVMLSPRMTEKAYSHFYESIYRPLVSAFHGRLIDAVTIQGEQLEYARSLGEFLLPFFHGRNAKTLLDIGGSTGVVAEYLSQLLGLSATVLDPAPQELANANLRGLTVVAGFLENYEIPESQRFNLITLCQTIDHLLDVKSSLIKIRHLLAEGGLFFVDIVDFRAAYLRNRSVEKAIKIDHPYYLTESTMESYLAQVGFQILRKNYAADHLHVGYVCALNMPRPDALPLSQDVSMQRLEVRRIQNGA